MTDQEIFEKLKKAAKHLDEYKTLALEVADELASRKSLVVYGRDGCYKGRLGCFEEGADTICLHLKDEEESDRYDPDRQDKAKEFEIEWYGRIIREGIQGIGLSGYH